MLELKLKPLSQTKPVLLFAPSIASKATFGEVNVAPIRLLEPAALKTNMHWPMVPTTSKPESTSEPDGASGAIEATSGVPPFWPQLPDKALMPFKATLFAWFEPSIPDDIVHVPETNAPTVSDTVAPSTK
ncbi:unannotated protein [freshwater metagenome]|uniref:Unannotated protein n=1 Tax=freshwater metagenome TaxID=449393 RepID=A0A6J7RN06_9ZZZZ